MACDSYMRDIEDGHVVSVKPISFTRPSQNRPFLGPSAPPIGCRTLLTLRYHFMPLSIHLSPSTIWSWRV